MRAEDVAPEVLELADDLGELGLFGHNLELAAALIAKGYHKGNGG